MAISRESLSEVIKPLIEGREDSADVLESILALDTESESNTDAVVEAAVSAALSDARKEFNSRFERAFFNPTAQEPAAAGGEATQTVVEDGDNNIPEAPSIADLLSHEEN